MNSDLRDGIVRILKPNGETAGTGFILTNDGLIATCSHVVQSHESQKRGDPSPEKRTIIFHVTGEPREAWVEQNWWRPSKGEDVAILRVDGDLPPQVRPLLLGSSSGTSNHSFDTFGFPMSNPKQGIWGEGHILRETKIQDVQVLQLSSKEVTPGFSGAPVVDRFRHRVVGMVTSIIPPDEYSRQAETAFITPTETLRDVCSALKLSDVCPYRSLEAFAEADAVFFTGRDRIIQALVDSLRKDSRFLAVFGPSGCGKSSVVQAGLIPRLREGHEVPGSDQWDILVTRPTDHSFEQFVSQLSQTTAHVALVIDQFEELFVTHPEAVRKKVVAELTGILGGSSHVTSIIVMRNDFYSFFVDEERLAQWKQDRLVDIPPTVKRDEVVAMVREPANTVGWQFEDEGLIETIVNDALESTLGDHREVGNSTILPLLEFALTQLWERRQDGALTRDAYKRIGGVTGGLAQWANDAYYNDVHFEKRQRPLVKRIFTDLVNLGDKDQPIPIPDSRTRRELVTLVRNEDEKADVYRVVQRLVDLRLLVKNRDTKSGRETVEIIHDALLREWALLKDWIEEDRLFLAWCQRLDDRIQGWIATDADDPTKRDAYKLLAGLDLTEATDWLTKRWADLNETQQRFIEASIRQKRQQEAAVQEQQRRELTLQRRIVSRQRLIVVALSVFSVIVIVLASVAQLSFLQAEVQRKNAEMAKHIAIEQANNAQSRALVADANASLAQKQLDRALLLSVKASQIADTYEARDSLLSTLTYSPHIITMLHLRLSRPYSYPVNSLAFSANGDLLFSADDHDVFAWYTRTKTSDILSQVIFTRILVLPQVASRHPHSISQIAVSRNDQLATLGPDGVWLWNARTGEQLTQLEGNDTQTRPSGWIGGLSLSFSPDGRLLAVGQCQQFTSTGNSVAHCDEAQIFLWDTASKKRIGSPFNIPNTEINSVAFSTDGKTLASGSDDGAARLWNISTGSLIGSPLTASAQPVSSVAFSPDGKTLASGNGDGSVRLWNVAAGTLLHSFVSENIKKISSVAFSPDGTIVASGSEDGTTRLWNVSTSSLIGSPFTVSPQPVSSVAFSPDGKTLVAGNDRDTIGVWNMGANSTIAQRLEYMRGLQSAVFSRDGKTLVTGSGDGKIVLWDIVQEKPIAILDTAVYPVIKPSQEVYGSLLSIQSLAISGDGRMIAAGRLDGVITLWDMKTKLPLAHFIHPNPLGKIIFGQDGRILASLSQSFSNETKVVLWDATTGTIIRSLPITYPNGYNAASSFSFSPDGKLLAIGICGQWNTQQQCMQGQILLWDITTGKLTNMPLPGLTDQVFDVAFSPDGRTLAASGPESILLVDMTTKKAIGQPLSFYLLVDTTSNVVGYYQHIAFSPDGRFLMSYGSAGFSPTDDVFILWDLIKHEPFTRAFPADSSLNDLIFYPNEQKLVSVGSLTSGKSAITLWDISLASLQAHACGIANRNFTLSEWKQYIPDQPYSKVCPNLPIDPSIT